jgi:spermidine synthase
MISFGRCGNQIIDHRSCNHRFIAAYACSGAAGLIYEVAWTRLLTLRLGHSVAATSTVVAAFMGGLAIGGVAGGRLASRLSARGAIRMYAALEAVVALTALTLPAQTTLLTPVLGLAYHDGAPGWAYGLLRAVASAGVLLTPAVAFGATFPIAVRWAVASGGGLRPGTLYAANTSGAAVGSVLAGFILMPALGNRGTALVGVAATLMAIALAWLTSRSPLLQPGSPETRADGVLQFAPNPTLRSKRRAAYAPAVRARPVQAGEKLAGAAGVYVPMAVASITGVTTLGLEIAWTRYFALLIGPSTYAISILLAVFIAGLAIGSIAGARVREPSGWLLAGTLGIAALTAALATEFAGGPLLRIVADDLARRQPTFMQLVVRGALWALALVLPTAIAIGAAFPMTLSLARPEGRDQPRVVADFCAVNTIAGVVGSIAAGFWLLPAFGLERTLGFAATMLAVGAALGILAGRRPRTRRMLALTPAVAALVCLASAEPWNRALLASGSYKYARYLPTELNLDAALTAGVTLYDRDGSTATVSVKDAAGVRSLSLDGKVDASTGADMITQKVLAHLPLLLHPAPRSIAIIGLGSGVTLGAALVHPIARADVVEISPEVVEASRLFDAENRRALDDSRVRLIVGDGRSHLELAATKYDVIVSEPSNPWMAGVAALFTREFFESARARLAPGGVLCQWMHTYDIASDDLRSLIATFAAVFREGTMWLLGEGDLLLVGSDVPLEPRVANVPGAWARPGVGEDLARVSIESPFVLLSSFVGGGPEMAAYAGSAPIQTDDRMAVEFTGPRAVNATRLGNADALAAMRSEGLRRSSVAATITRAGAEAWRGRGRMMLKANAPAAAYEDFARALGLDPADSSAARGFIDAAAASDQVDAAAQVLESLAAAYPDRVAPRVALSRLRMSTGAVEAALAAASEASRIEPTQVAAFDQLASIYADLADIDALASVVSDMKQRFPQDAATWYYTAALAFMRGQMDEARTIVERAIALDANRAAAFNMLGAVYATQGATEPARAALRRALAIEPRDLATYENLAQLEMSVGNASAAARFYAEALIVDPRSASARNGLARARAAAQSAVRRPW